MMIKPNLNRPIRHLGRRRRLRLRRGGGQRLDEALPVPVPRPHLAQRLDGHALGLRQEEEYERRHDDDPARVVREGAVLEAAEHVEERLRLREGEQERDGLAHPLPRRPHLQRVYLAGHDPLERAPRHPEPGREHAHQRHHRHRVPPRHRLPAVGAQLGAKHPRHAHQARKQDAAADHEQRPPPDPVHHRRRHGDRRQAHHVGYDGPQDRLLAREPDRVEEERREERDHDHARQLEEHRDRHGHHQVGTVLAPDDPPERAGLVPPVLLRRLHDVLELRLHAGVVPPAADPAERAPRRVHFATEDEAVGGVRDEEGAEEDDGGRHDADAEGEAPPPPSDRVGAVVDEVGHEDADVEEEVEDAGERAAPPCGRDLGEVHGRRLVGEADGDAEEDAADHEHGDVGGGAVEDGAREEERRADQHGVAAADTTGDVAGDQAGDHAGEVEGGDEGCKQLAVEDAVLVLRRVVHLLDYVREEGLQERLHLRQTT
ncbi:unnamed protein product [Urochloa decumbens]|uniref:Uncharacterized protein n=1 Tax=Urochloa decumbens TaxID=240449 RepID=A0ABC9CIK2_9POAL